VIFLPLFAETWCSPSITRSRRNAGVAFDLGHCRTLACSRTRAVAAAGSRFAQINDRLLGATPDRMPRVYVQSRKAALPMTLRCTPRNMMTILVNLAGKRTERIDAGAAAPAACTGSVKAAAAHRAQQGN